MRFSDFRARFPLNNATNILIAANVAVFLVIVVTRLVLVLFNVEFEPRWLELSADPGVAIMRPWSYLTYAFVHTGFFHILFNMLALIWFGRIAEENFSRGHIFALYAVGAVAGGLLFQAAFAWLPYFGTHFPAHTCLLGASAAVLAVTTAAAVAEPERQLRFFLLGGVRLKWLAVTMVVVSFFGITGQNAGGDVAHLGGALAGVVYALVLRRWRSRRQSGPRLKPRYHFRRGVRSEERHTAPESRPESRDVAIDRVLEKIKRSGYASLTEEERELLFKQNGRR